MTCNLCFKFILSICRVPAWDAYLLSTKLSHSIAANDALTSINKQLSNQLLVDTKDQLQGGAQPGRTVQAHTTLLARCRHCHLSWTYTLVQSFTLTREIYIRSAEINTKDQGVDVQYRLCKRKNLLLAQAADSFARFQDDVRTQMENLERSAMHMEEEHTQQVASFNPLVCSAQDSMAVLIQSDCTEGV